MFIIVIYSSSVLRALTTMTALTKLTRIRLDMALSHLLNWAPRFALLQKIAVGFGIRVAAPYVCRFVRVLHLYPLLWPTLIIIYVSFPTPNI